MKSKIKNEKEKNSINWDKPQLVVLPNPKLVILTDGIHEGEKFNGIVVFKGDSGHFIGHTSRYWRKESFRPFKGSITLKND